ncbi:hypothetical protein NKG94_41205 [Micromonospora sp. M12]
MQRASAGLARRAALLLAERGGVYGGRVLLLVGSGDNGGDALYAGSGWPVEVSRCPPCCSPRPCARRRAGRAACCRRPARVGTERADRPGPRRDRRHRWHRRPAGERGRGGPAPR